MNILNAAGYIGLCVWATLCPIASKADAIITNRISLLEAPFQVKGCDALAIHKINDYVRPMKPGARRLLRQMDRYFPVIEQLLREKRLPDFLKYIPVAESKLSIKVISPHGAAGLWQLMPNTARNYGLEVSERIDERLDPERATYAALNFLEDLYYEFEDWGLALAAYNCGPGKVNRAIKRGHSRHYNDIKLLLPKQTRHYLPSLIAAAYLDLYFRKRKLPTTRQQAQPVPPKEEFFSTLPANFFQKAPELWFEPAGEGDTPPAIPAVLPTLEMVQVRPGQRIQETGEGTCKRA